MQKRKGFTLIELLAVIVILAIIALIATPIVLNIIEKAEKGAAKSSAYGVVESLKLKYAESLLDGNFKGASYNFEDVSGDLLGISNKPEKGIITLDSNGHISGNVTYNGYTFYICNDKVSEESSLEENCGVEEIVDNRPQCIKDGYCANGTAIYFNPETNEYCDSNTAVSTTGTKTGCMKWYTFNDSSESSTVNMILDHNTTATVAWNSENTNTEMKEVAEALVNDTTTWNENIKNTARLITVDEVVQITNNPTFNTVTATTDEWFYFESNTQDMPEPYTGKYAWLYDYTSKCIVSGCNTEDNDIRGYWTSTSVADVDFRVWYIDSTGMGCGSTYLNQYFGVRPVITILKTNLQ